MTAGGRRLRGTTVDIPQVGAACGLEVGDHDANHSARLEDSACLQQKSARDRAVEMLEDVRMVYDIHRIVGEWDSSRQIVCQQSPAHLLEPAAPSLIEQRRYQQTQ